jgi:hypothetical protein
MTNAGKTFTVLGTDGNPGLLPRAVSDIVDAVQEVNRQQLRRGMGVSPSNSSSDDLVEIPRTPLPDLAAGETMSVSVSCVEIYNEQVFDGLVVPPADTNVPRAILKVKDGPGGRVFVQGAKLVDVATTTDCMQVGDAAAAHRTSALHDGVSRAWCITAVS